MPKTILIFLVITFFCLIGFADEPTSSPTTQPTAKLRIEIIDIRNSSGQLIFGVFKTEDGFPSDSKKALNWQIKPADSKGVAFECELPPGKYGASVLHDENSNGQMDLGHFGIPTEGYGETNNPKPSLRAATFKESLFTLPPEGATLKISVQYF